MTYSLKEEIANAITHGIGILLSIPALVLLIVFASKYGTVWHIVSFSIFGTTMLLLYLFSTLTHGITKRSVKDVFERLDHVGIFLLIAGTYTPYLLVTIRGALGWTIFGIIWGLAIAGIVFKMFFVKRLIKLSTLLYIFMGWLVLIVAKPIYDGIGFEGFMWMLVGGLFYTIGSVFYVWRKIPFHHAIWHTFVLLGSAAMYVSVLFYVLPN